MIAPRAGSDETGAPSRLQIVALGICVALVLADSSVVILALPRIRSDFAVGVPSVAWVLSAFNLVLALTAVPAALVARRIAPARLAAAGLTVFGVASLVCADAHSLTPLVIARCVQAAGGAFAVCAALPLLRAGGADAGGALAVWVGASVVGTAVGPAVGGAMTQLISWRSIFVVQVPIALAAVPVVLAMRDQREAREPSGLPRVAANLALALTSAALTAALFLTVILLTEGWRLSPIEAALAVTATPVTAMLAPRLAIARGGGGRTRAAAGAIAVAGGLASLAVLPSAHAWLVVPPLLLTGAGLGLCLPSLTAAALHGRGAPVVHGGWTIASRHLGVVLGLLLLTPIFASDLVREEHAARASGISLLLEAPLPLHTKFELAGDLDRRLRGNREQVPDVRPVFAAHTVGSGDEAAYRQLESALTDQIARAATHAFSRSYWLAALLAALALPPVLVVRRHDA